MSPSCPDPLKPTLEKADTITIQLLLFEMAGMAEYSRALELQVQCYKAVYAPNK